MIDVSIIIVNWNTKDLLLNCIRSLYAHTHRMTIEIIVVDNGSTDGSQEAIHASYPDVNLICNTENLGFAKANNIGIKASKGRYICLVNSDIKLLDDVIDHLCLYMNTHLSIGAIGPKTINEDVSVRFNCREFPSMRNLLCDALFLDQIFPNVKLFRSRLMKYFDHQSTTSVPVLSGCFLMVRREIIETVGLLDEAFFIYGEDVDWCKRIHEHGWENIFYGDSAAIHYAGASSSKTPHRFLVEMLKSDLHYWKKHHHRLKRALVVGIYIVHYLLRTAIWLMIHLSKRAKNKQIKDKLMGYFVRLRYLVLSSRTSQMYL